MRAWTVIIALGIIGLAGGAVLFVLDVHRTIGLGGLGLGAVLAIIGTGGSLRRRKGTGVQSTAPIVPKVQRAAYRKAIIAVLVVVLIGVGTFYGTTYLAGVQGGLPRSGISTSVSGLSSQASSAVGTSSSGSISTYYTNASSSSTSTISTISVTGISSVSSRSTTVSASTSFGTSSSTVSSETTSTGTGTLSSTSSTSSSTSEPFVILGSPSVTVQEEQVYLSAEYTNIGTSTTQVNVYAEVSHESGGVVGSGNILSQPPTVSPGDSFDVSATLGTFQSGSYTVTFYVVEYPNSTQISTSTTINFDV